MGKSHSTTTYIIAAMVLGFIFFVFTVTTPPTSMGKTRDGGEREKKGKESQELFLACIIRERECHRRQPAGRFFISVLFGRWYKTIENQSRYFTITLLLAQSMIDHITHRIDNKIRFSRRYGAVGTIRVREPAFEADCCSSLGSLHARCAQPLCCTVRAV
jgi:hypothetical protein